MTRRAGQVVRQEARLVQKIATDVVRDHAYHCVDCLRDPDELSCECPTSDYEFYKNKLMDPRADVMKVHAEHVAWVISQKMKGDR